MSSDLSQNIKAAFAGSMRAYAARTLKTPEDWRALHNIEKRYGQARAQARQAFQDDAPRHLAQARQAIIQERSQYKPQPRPPIRTDPLHYQALEDQAQRRVAHTQARRLMAIDRRESRAIDRLLTQVKARDKPKAGRDFARVTPSNARTPTRP